MTINAATQPANVGSIMQDMMSKMVTPEAIPANGAVHAPVAPSPTPAPSAPVSAKPAAPAPAAPAAPAAQAPSAKVETSFFADEPAEEPAQETAPVVDEEPDMSDVPETPAAENFRKMRESLKTDRKALKKTQRELAAAQAERDAWVKGEKIPDILTAKDTRIQELEKYEHMLNGQLSREYQDLVVKPAGETREAFTKLAENYQVPDNIRDALVQKIVATENEKERNALITQYFPDAIGANKAKELVTKMHELGQTAIEMEKKPLETKQTLQAKYQEKVKAEETQRASIFEAMGKKGWSEAMAKTASEEIYSNLILDPTNPEHNKVAEKNQHRASIQYGALLKKLHQNGLQTMPEDLAVGLARMNQLAIGGVMAYNELAKVKAELAAIKGSSSVQTTYFRPSPNGNGSMSAAPKQADPGPRSPREAGQRAIQNLK